MSKLLKTFYKYPDSRRPDNALIKLLEINLTRNDFEFDGKYFLQIKGTAMGKKFAPAYADIFMAEWETAALEKCIKKTLHYYRYLDDIWGIWTHTEEEFKTFFSTLNNHNPSIKLKYTMNHESIDFIYTTTYKGKNFTQSNSLDIKVYFKDTDTHALLQKSSFHPKRTFAGLIKSQLLRFHRICTQPEDFRRATWVLFSALSSRGYSRAFSRGCFKTFLQSKPVLISTALPFVTTYSPSTTKMVKQIKNNFESIWKSNQLQEDIRIIAAFRKNKNLKDYLDRSKVKPRLEGRPGPNTDFFRQQKWVYDFYKQKVFKMATYANVYSKNCVYMISCKQCGLRYVGETRLSIQVRFTCHKYKIVRQKNTNRHVLHHFILHGWGAVQAAVLECNPHWSTAQRRRAERDWISKLGTTFPQGLNERLYFRP